MLVSRALMCNSSDNHVTSLIWKRDGFLLGTNPLVLTDTSTASYTNVLHINNRTTGAYTCLVRGPNDELLNSSYNIQCARYIVNALVLTMISCYISIWLFDTKISAASPPVNAKARQSGASAPVEVSWSPPSDGATTITG